MKTLATTPTLVQQVQDAILAEIASGKLQPGARVIQEQLAAELGVSRQPVQQALVVLRNLGVLHDAPGRGLQVAPLDVQAIRQIYQVRGALDALAARLAAQRRFRIDPQLMEAGRAAARSDNVAAMIDADLAFHRALYEAAGNPLIGESAQLHWRHLKRVMGAVLQEMHQRDAVWDEHQAIADAIAAGDAEGAARLIEEHSLQASQVLAERLDFVLQSAPTNDPRRQP